MHARNPRQNAPFLLKPPRFSTVAIDAVNSIATNILMQCKFYCSAAIYMAKLWQAIAGVQNPADLAGLHIGRAKLSTAVGNLRL
jgi:hypothetical protein